MTKIISVSFLFFTAKKRIIDSCPTGILIDLENKCTNEKPEDKIKTLVKGGRRMIIKHEKE
jgi:hypothetical protein